MSETENKRLYCATDRTPANAIIAADGSKTVKCPTCGQTDDLKQATADAVRGMVQGMIGGAFGGSKAFTVRKSGPSPRWFLAD